MVYVVQRDEFRVCIALSGISGVRPLDLSSVGGLSSLLKMNFSLWKQFP